MSPEILKKALAVSKEQDGAAALALIDEMIVEYASGAPADEAPADPTAAAAAPEPTEEEKALAALSREVVMLTGAKSAGEAATRVKDVFAAHKETEERARTLEASERRSLVASLVKIGAETPATAWENVDAEGDARVPVKFLADMPIAQLRSRVEALSAARPVTRSRPVVTETEEPGRTVKTSKGEIKLSAREIKNCKELNVTVENYAENKAIREAAKRK